MLDCRPPDPERTNFRCLKPLGCGTLSQWPQTTVRCYKRWHSSMWAPLGLAVSLVCAGTGKAHLAGALCPPPASPSTPTPALWAAQPFLREGGDRAQSRSSWGKCLYIVVLVSIVQRNKSAICCVPISTLFWISFPFRSPQSIK